MFFFDRGVAGRSAGMVSDFSRRILAFGFASLLLGARLSFAQDTTVPPNTLPCDAFIKKEDGSWLAKKRVSFDVGKAKDVTVDQGTIMPKSRDMGGIDLYVLLDAKCGKTSA
jgi:hypothetical protein